MRKVIFVGGSLDGFRKTLVETPPVLRFGQVPKVSLTVEDGYLTIGDENIEEYYFVNISGAEFYRLSKLYTHEAVKKLLDGYYP